MAVCGPFRLPEVVLGAGRLGKAEPGLARALLVGCCRSPGAITPPDPQEAAMRPSGAEWKRWNEGKKEDMLKSQLRVPLYFGAFLSPTSSEHSIPVFLLLLVLRSYFPRLRCSRSSRACPLCSELRWESVALADA